MPYYDNFWHGIKMHTRISSPACLIFFVKLKTENQLIRLEAASDSNMVRHPLQQSVIDQAIDQWQVCPNAYVKAKGKHFELELRCAAPQLNTCNLL